MSSFDINRLKREELYTIGHYTGYVSLVIGIFMLPSVLVSIIYHEDPVYLFAFLISAIILILLGGGLVLYFRKRSIPSLSLKGSLIFVLSIWGLSALFCGLPFLFTGDLGMFDSYFEGMSAITTTGMSIQVATTHSVTIWESLAQWLGGLGLIILILVLVPSSPGLKKLYLTEGRTEQITPNIKHSTFIFIRLYLILTALALFLYLVVGLNVFDAICYGVCSISTGGFTISTADPYMFNYPAVQLVGMFLMLLGGTNFIIIYNVLKGNVRKYIKDVELKAMFAIIVVATILLVASLYYNGLYGDNLFTIFRNSLFQIVMIVTSAGFTALPMDTWPSFDYNLLILLMFIGGCVCSTSGGLRIYNVVLVLKSIWWEAKSMFLPKNTVIIRKVYHDGKNIEVTDPMVKSILIYFIIYIMIFLISTFVILLVVDDFQMAYTLSASGLGNTGYAPSFVDVSTHVVVKSMLIIDFWIGRMSLWPLLLSIVYGVNMISDRFESLRNR